MSSEHISAAEALLAHLTSPAIGGAFSASLQVTLDPKTGLSIASTSPIPAEETLISCPFDYAITPALATRAICAVTGSGEAKLESWTERMRICGYICLHWIYLDLGKPHPSLVHTEYVAALPPASTLRTPLHFTEAEMQLLEGSNLFGATRDRKMQLKEEHKRLQEVIQLDGLTWERYLTAATYISSRAFPSKLLRIPDVKLGSTSTSAVDTSEEEESHPVLLPGVDLFNHARGQPITWLTSLVPSKSSTSTPTSIPAISLVAPHPLEPFSQVFNNYGPKPNEEFLLAYGFVLDPNPDDAVVLRLGGFSGAGAQVGPGGGQGISEAKQRTLKSKGLDAGKRWLVKKDGEVERGLLEVMRVLLGDDLASDHGGHGHDEDDEDEEDDHGHDDEAWKAEMNLELDVLGALGQMMDDKLAKLSEVDLSEVEARDDVRYMCEVYRRGQVEILEAAMSKLEERIERVDRLLDEGQGCPCCN